MDEIIDYLRRMDEENVTSDDYEKVGELVSTLHLKERPRQTAVDFAEMVEKTDRIENALLAGAYDDEPVDVSQCILVLRGHKEPEEAELPEPSMEAFDEAMSGVDEGFQQFLINLADAYDREPKDLSGSSSK